VIIRDGRAERIDIDDRHWYYAGGGIYSIHASLVFSHCTVTENDAVTRYYSGGSAYIRGGGAYLVGGTHNFTDCRFSANVGDSGYSAGMIADSTTITLTNCLFSGNGYGASIGMGRSTATIDSCSFLENNGNGLSVGGSFTIEDCSFEGNNGPGLGLGGQGSIARCSFIGNTGGIRGGSSGVTIEKSLFQDNRDAFEGGGIWFEYESAATINNCTFRNNEAEFGGAISALHGAEVTLEHCVLVGNSAGYWGGGFYGRDRVNMDIVNCTLYGNSADRGGGAIGAGYGFSPLLKNSIFYENGEHQIYCTGDGWATLYVMYSDIQGGRDGVALNNAGEIARWDESIDADPLFVDADEEDFHLTAESLCIDTGDPHSPKDPDSTRADMGAFYYPQEIPIPDIFVEPDSIVFPPTDVEEIAVDTLTIRNLGSDTLEVSSLSLIQDVNLFAIIRGGDSFNLEPQGSHQTVLAFSPEDSGQYRAVLRIESNDPDQDTLDVPISGTAIIRAPDITADADTLDFGIVAVGDHSDRTVTIANRGDQVLNIWSVSVVFDELGFELVSGGGQRQVMPDSSFQIVLQFTPNREGDFADTLTVSSDDGDTPELDIALLGVSPLSVNGGSGGPFEFSLQAVSPNPFNSSYAVSYQLSSVSRVSLKLYDVSGRLVSNQELGIRNPGEHRAVINGTSLSSGVYILKLTAGRDVATRKIVCVR